MDIKKLQEKYKITPKELVKEMKAQANDVVDLLGKEIDELGATERINNLKDLYLRNMKVMGMIDENNKWEYGMLTNKSILKQYWKQRDLPIEERAIYQASYTDKGLREHQQKRLDKLKERSKIAGADLKHYKDVIKEWWQQRAEEAIAEHDPGPPKTKLNGKGKNGKK